MDNKKLRKIVAEQLNEGLSLSQIQDILSSEHKYNITFLDLRLLASELENVDWTSGEEEVTEAEAPPVDEKVEDAGEPQAGSTQIEISKLVRPGAMISGSVTFASGASAEWILDRTGRLSLDKQNGKPTEEDLVEFQNELQNKLSQGA